MSGEWRKRRSVENSVIDPQTGNLKTSAKVIAEHLDGLDPSNISYKVVAREIHQTKTIKDFGLTPDGPGYSFVRRLADFIERMGPEASEKAIVGFIRSYDRLINNAAGTDRFEDMLALMRPDTAAGKTALKESLESFKDASDGAELGAQVKLFVKGVETVHPMSYRYMSDINLIEQSGWKLPAHDGRGWYCSFDNFADPATAKSKMQLPAENTAQYRIEFETSSVKDNVRLPYGAQESKPFFEPVNRDYPELGSGGATQVLVDGAEIPVNEIWDISVSPAVCLYPIE